MLSTSIILPKRTKKRLKEESEETGVSEEELVLYALSKIPTEPLDPETRVEVHLKLSEKYMRDAEDFYPKGLRSGIWKGLGAAAQIVKALAIRGGVELRGHREPRREVIKVAKESKVVK